MISSFVMLKSDIVQVFLGWIIIYIGLMVVSYELALIQQDVEDALLFI